MMIISSHIIMILIFDNNNKNTNNNNNNNNNNNKCNNRPSVIMDFRGLLIIPGIVQGGGIKPLALKSTYKKRELQSTKHLKNNFAIVDSYDVMQEVTTSVIYIH